MPPDLKVLWQDEAKGTLALRTKDGAEVTLPKKDIADRKSIVTGTDGNSALIGSPDLSQVPAWVPKVPAFCTARRAARSADSFPGKAP